jgi:hypothetical protein
MRALPMKPYGETWNIDDVVGCLIDLDEQVISYTQNGKDLGVAFSNFREKDETSGKFLSYCPAITTDKHVPILLNLGLDKIEYVQYVTSY